ncbi:MAG: hypothetical protein KME16_00515 [Scytolyngbya sp. HA4215-MV1]|nr:hypothetical protein [Scytolyngbya sp. HA4215-MV1]
MLRPYKIPVGRRGVAFGRSILQLLLGFSPKCRALTKYHLFNFHSQAVLGDTIVF